MIKKAIQFLKEARNELKKVTWSERKEVIGATVTIVFLIILIAMFVGIIDFGLSRILGILLR